MRAHRLYIGQYDSVAHFPASDRYRSEGLLGEGATGQVYAVVDLQENRRLALKLVTCGEPAEFDSLRDEFLILSHLRHPLLAQVYDFGRFTPSGPAYFTQELVDGVAPGVWVGDDHERLVSIGLQLAWVLGYIHGQGVLHLDVKPGNIRIEDGRLRLLDFGLARRGVDAGFTGGTPAYMAPEVLAGRPLDARTDLYGLGATLYELMTGRPPFVGRTLAEVVEQALFQAPLLPREAPAALRGLLAQLLEKDPNRRPHTAIDVVSCLRAFSEVGLPALPPGLPGLIGRAPVEQQLRVASGVIHISGPPGTGRRTLMRRRLQQAQAEGLRTGVGRGRGLDALEMALRKAGASPTRPPTAGASPDDARAARLEVLVASLEQDMVLGLIDPGDLPDFETSALVMVTTEEKAPGAVVLEPLSEEEVRRFLQGAWLGQSVTDDQVAHALHRTGGLPQRLAWYVADPDADFEARTRAKHRSDTERQVLQALALLPSPATAAQLSRTTGLGDVHGALVHLVTAGLVVTRSSGEYALCPEELQVLLSEKPIVSKAATKRQACAALKIAPTLAALRLSGKTAQFIRGLREAVAQTLELTTCRELQEELYAQTGLLSDGLDLEKMLEESGDHEAQAALLAELDPSDPRVRIRRAFAAMRSGHEDEARAEAAQARALSDDSELRARALRIDGLVAQRRGDHRRASEAFAAARTALPPEGCDPILRAHTVHDLGVTALYLGHFAEAMPSFRESLRIKIEQGDRSGARIARQNIGICHEALGEPRRAIRAWEEALSDARRTGSRPGEVWNHMALAGLLRRLGNRAEAESQLLAAESRLQSLDQALLATGVAAERALLEASDTDLIRRAEELRTRGDAYNADRLVLEHVARQLRAGQSVAELVVGRESFPERFAGLNALRAVRAGETVALPEGTDVALIVARAEQLRAIERPHEAAQWVRDALECSWAVWERAWLQETLGPEPVHQRASEAAHALQILDLNRSLCGMTHSSEILERVLDVAIEVTGAERGFLLLADGEDVEVSAARNLDKERVRRGKERISRGVALEVLRTGEPVRLVDARAADELQVDASIQTLKLQSVLCVPFVGRASTPLGCLYLDHRFQTGVFGPDLVRFVQLLGDQAALVFEMARLVESERAHSEEVQRLNRLLTEQAAETKGALEATRVLLEATRSELHTRFVYAGVVGRSPALKRTFALLDRVIPTELSVLLEGESGTGKELLARAVHEGSARNGGPFVAVNCGAIPHELVDSAFFGHRKGAFTGADRDRSGYFALSDGGTLFLDELGELPLPAQARLLRVLETGTYWPVGGTAEQRCDVRVVAATNRELEAMTADGTFRDDLFYRVAQVRIPVPPLRERLEDIPVLVEHFLAGAPIHFEARRLLMSYHWPGNVRELRNELERAVALRGDEEIDVSLFSPTVQAARGKSAEEATGELPVFRSDLKAYLDGIERRVVGEVLAHCEGNLTQAAKRLGVSRHGLRKKLLRLGLRS